MTMSDLWPGFRGHDIFWSRISEKRRVLRTQLLLHKRKHMQWYCVLWPSLTSKHDARVCEHQLSFLLPARRSKRDICFGNVAGWVSVRHASVLYQNGYTYLTTFYRLVAPSFLFLLNPAPIQKFKGRHLQWGYIYTGVGKIGDCRRKLPFISEKVRHRPMVTVER